MYCGDFDIFFLEEKRTIVDGDERYDTCMRSGERGWNNYYDVLLTAKIIVG